MPLAQNLFEQNMTVIDWFLVDEAQFLTAGQIDQLARIVDDFGSNVICFGLRTDFQSRLFEGSRRLFEIADTIDEIKSTCTCGRKTIVNARIDASGDIVTEGAQVEIGGDERDTLPCAANAGATDVSSSRRACRSHLPNFPLPPATPTDRRGTTHSPTPPHLFPMTSSHITKLLRAIIILAVAIVMSHAPCISSRAGHSLSIPRESLSL